MLRHLAVDPHNASLAQAARRLLEQAEARSRRGPGDARESREATDDADRE